MRSIFCLVFVFSCALKAVARPVNFPGVQKVSSPYPLKDMISTFIRQKNQTYAIEILCQFEESNHYNLIDNRSVKFLPERGELVARGNLLYYELAGASSILVATRSGYAYPQWQTVSGVQIKTRYAITADTWDTYAVRTMLEVP